MSHTVQPGRTQVGDPWSKCNMIRLTKLFPCTSSTTVEIFEDACPNYLQISRRFFGISMGILKVFESPIIIIN
jgi:hypothetical protein